MTSENTESMYDRTIRLLHAQKGRWPSICAETGLDYEWLNKLSRGQINDPGVRKIQKLHDYLSSQQEQ